MERRWCAKSIRKVKGGKGKRAGIELTTKLRGYSASRFKKEVRSLKESFTYFEASAQNSQVTCGCNKLIDPESRCLSIRGTYILHVLPNLQTDFST